MSAAWTGRSGARPGGMGMLQAARAEPGRLGGWAGWYGPGEGQEGREIGPSPKGKFETEFQIET